MNPFECINLLLKILKYILCLRPGIEAENTQNRNQLRIEFECEKSLNDNTELVSIQILSTGALAQCFHVRRFLWSICPNQESFVCFCTKREKFSSSLLIQQKSNEAEEIPYIIEFSENGKPVLHCDKLKALSLCFEEYVALCFQTEMLVEDKDRIAEIMLLCVRKFSIFSSDMSFSFRCGQKSFYRDAMQSTNSLEKKLEIYFACEQQEKVSGQCLSEKLNVLRGDKVPLKVIYCSTLKQCDNLHHLHIFFYGPGNVPLNIDPSIWSSFLNIKCKGFDFIVNYACNARLVTRTALTADMCYIVRSKNQKSKLNNLSYYLFVMFSGADDQTLYDAFENFETSVTAVLKRNKTCVLEMINASVKSMLQPRLLADVKSLEDEVEDLVSSSIARVVRHSLNEGFRKSCFDLLGATSMKDAEVKFLQKLSESTTVTTKLIGIEQAPLLNDDSPGYETCSTYTDSSQVENSIEFQQSSEFLPEDEDSFSVFEELLSEVETSSEDKFIDDPNFSGTSTTIVPNMLEEQEKKMSKNEEVESTEKVQKSILGMEIFVDNDNLDNWFDDEFLELDVSESLLDNCVENASQEEWVEKALVDIDSWK